MKTNIKTLIACGLATTIVFASCQKDMLNSEQYAGILDVSTDGTSTVINQNMYSAFVEAPDLTGLELTTLLKMKDEEKLARDVYASLYQKWNSQVFSRISYAENNHLNAIVNILKYYEQADTLVEETGVFADNEMQNIYNELLSKGSASIEEAYKTGALIEEMDIKDLNNALAETSNANISMVYENLMKGSRNHLRSFYKQLNNVGTIYTPIYLSENEYNQIVTSPIEKGKQYQMKGKDNGACDGSGKGKRKGKN